MRKWWLVLGVGSACLLGCADGESDDTDTPDTDDTDGADTTEALDPSRGSIGCADGAVTIASEDPLTVETKHFRLLVLDGAVDRVNALVLATLVEASWDAWTAHFGDIPAPADRYEVVLADDEPTIAAQVADDGDTFPAGFGGYYSYISGRAYLYRQPSAYYDRVLLLHEVTHLVHHAVRAAEEAPPDWFVEGLAEHLSLHDWDGDRCVALGVNPLGTAEDRLQDAADAPPAGEGALIGWLANDSFPSRAATLGWWRYLETAADDRAAFRTWRLDADAGTVGFDTLDDVIDVDAVFDDYLAWLDGEAPSPYQPLFNQWLPLDGDTIRGWADVSSALLWRGPDGTLSVEHPAPKGEGLAGVLVAWDGPNDWTGVMVDREGVVDALVVQGGTPRWDPVGTVDKPKGKVAWEVSISGGTPSVTVGGQTFTPEVAATPRLGLTLMDADVRFDRLSVAP